MKINGKTYKASQMTAIHAAIIASLAKEVSLEKIMSGDLAPVASAIPSVSHAVQELFGVPDGVLEGLPFHEFIMVVEAAIQEYLSENAGYFAEQVTPAVSNLSATIIHLAKTISGMDSVETPAAQ